MNKKKKSKQFLRKKSFILVILTLSTLLITLLGVSSIYIYKAISKEDENTILQDYIASLSKSKLESDDVDDDYRYNLLESKNAINNVTINCEWVNDLGNKNITFSKVDYYVPAINKDVVCDVFTSNKNGEKNLVKNQLPLFIFDDFVQNFFSNDFLLSKGVKIKKDISFFNLAFGQTNDYQAIVDFITSNSELVKEIARRIVKTTLLKINYLSELSLVNRIIWQNRDSSSNNWKDANGVYLRFPYQNDINNNREIKIIVDTYNDQTKPLEGDYNTEPNLRFDLENALATIVHEYGHHLTLFSNHINKETFLKKFKELFSNASFGLNSEGNKVFGSWNEFEKLYRYANGLNSTTSEEEIITIFRKLYGMHKYNSAKSTISNPSSFTHQVKYWVIDDETNYIAKDFDPNKEWYINSKFQRTSLDEKIEGAQKINTMLLNTPITYQVGYSWKNTSYKFELNCSNEYFYFYSNHYDYEAYLYQQIRDYVNSETKTRQDNSLLNTIKYFFSYEELLARIISVLTFQYNHANNNIRPPKNCGFNIKESLYNSNSLIINFDSKVRLENTLLRDHLALKRMGIDVFSQAKELIDFFIPFKTNQTKINQSISFLSFIQDYSNARDFLYMFPFNTKKISNLNDKYEKYDKRYKLLSLVTLEDSLKKYLFDIKITNVLNSTLVWRATPFNYSNINYYKYKIGYANTMAYEAFEQSNLLNNQYGISFDIAGEGLAIQQMSILINNKSLSNAVVFIDKNKNNKFDSDDIKLKITT